MFLRRVRHKQSDLPAYMTPASTTVNVPPNAAPHSSHHRPQQSKTWFNWLAVAAACIFWMSVSSGLILVNKHIMVDYQFKFPITVAALGMITSSILCFVCCKILRLFECNSQVNLKFYTTKVLPVGFFMAITFVTGNTGYLFLTVSFVQMLKAFCPVITMLLLFSFGLETPTRRLVISVSLIAGGIALASYGEMNFHVWGVIAMSISVVSECIRLVMVQHVLSGHKFSPMEGIYYMAPACSLWLTVLVLILEPVVLFDSTPISIIKAHPIAFALSSVMGFMVNVSAFIVIKLASSLTLKVLGSVKDTLLVVVGVVIFGEVVTRLQALGYCISLIGFAWYNVIKMHSTPASSELTPKTSDLDVRVKELSEPLLPNTSPKIKAHVSSPQR